MKKMTLAKICEWLNVNLQGNDVEISGVSTDTRTVQPGELFVALIGPNFDGHAFIQVAKARGAAGVLVSRPVTNLLPSITVKDTRLALGQLASKWRDQFSLPIVAVTGSSGKTTVKEMTANIFSQAGATLSTQGNLNNDIGVPLTLSRLNEQHRFAVIEMGANHMHEIAYTMQLAKPTIALINNVAPAHLAGFGSLEGVAKAKGEIYEYLPANGTAIVNLDDQFAEFWKKSLGSKRCITFGMTSTADFHASDIQPDPMGKYIFQLHAPQGQVAIHLPLPGKHNVMNALAASAATFAAGIDLKTIKQGLERVKPVKGRLISHKTAIGVHVIDDTYNANPSSVKAALEVLAGYAGERIFVLGDMGELGEEAAHYHAVIGQQAHDLGIQQMFSCGVLTAHAVEAFGKGGQHFATQEELVNALQNVLKPNMTVLVKGSRSAKMENVVTAIAGK